MRKLALLIVLTMVAVAAFAQPQQGPDGEARRGPRRGGPRVGADTDWMLLCFELKVPMETLEQLRPAFQLAYDDQRELFKDMLSGEIDRGAMMEEMAAIRTDLLKEYESVLTEEQRAALVAAREKMRSRGRPPGQGGARGRR